MNSIRSNSFTYLASMLLMFFLTQAAYAQKINFRFAFGDRAATIYPFTHAFDKTFYPVVQTGIEYNYFNKKRCSLYQTAILHYNYHKYLGHDIGIISEFAFTYYFKKPVYIQTDLGIGYMMEIPSVKTYKLNKQGEYVSTIPVLSMCAVPLTLAVGYEFKNRISIFLSYQYEVQFPYNKTIPLVPTDNLMLGMKYRILKIKNEKK